MPIKTITDSIYRIKTTLIYKEKDQVVIDYLIKKTGKDYQDYFDRSAGFFCSADSFNYYIIIRSDTINWLKVLAHECLHVTSRALRARGFHLADESEEAFTYYLAWLVSELSVIFTNQKRARPMKKAMPKMAKKSDIKAAMKKDKKDDMKMMNKMMMKKGKK